MKQFESFRLDTSNECLWHSGAQIALASQAICHSAVSCRKSRPPHYPRRVARRAVAGDLCSAPGAPDLHARTAQGPGRRCGIATLYSDHSQARLLLCCRGGGRRRSKKRRHRSVSGPCFAPASAHGSPLHVHRSRRGDAPPAIGAAIGAGGQRQAIFVTGGTGIGKTALVDAFLRHAASAVTIARGQCVEALGRKEEYYPLMEALASSLRFARRRSCVPDPGAHRSGLAAGGRD